jgi:hypothetical protein
MSRLYSYQNPKVKVVPTVTKQVIVTVSEEVPKDEAILNDIKYLAILPNENACMYLLKVKKTSVLATTWTFEVDTLQFSLVAAAFQNKSEAARVSMFRVTSDLKDDEVLVDLCGVNEPKSSITSVERNGKNVASTTYFIVLKFGFAVETIKSVLAHLSDMYTLTFRLKLVGNTIVMLDDFTIKFEVAVSDEVVSVATNFSPTSFTTSNLLLKALRPNGSNSVTIIQPPNFDFLPAEDTDQLKTDYATWFKKNLPEQLPEIAADKFTELLKSYLNGRAALIYTRGGVTDTEQRLDEGHALMARQVIYLRLLQQLSKWYPPPSGTPPAYINPFIDSQMSNESYKRSSNLFRGGFDAAAITAAANESGRIAMAMRVELEALRPSALIDSVKSRGGVAQMDGRTQDLKLRNDADRERLKRSTSELQALRVMCLMCAVLAVFFLVALMAVTAMKGPLRVSLAVVSAAGLCAMAISGLPFSLPSIKVDIAVA